MNKILKTLNEEDQKIFCKAVVKVSQKMVNVKSRNEILYWLWLTIKTKREMMDDMVVTINNDENGFLKLAHESLFIKHKDL